VPSHQKPEGGAPDQKELKASGEPAAKAAKGSSPDHKELAVPSEPGVNDSAKGSNKHAGRGRRDVFSRVLLVAGLVLIVAAIGVAGYLFLRNHNVNTAYDQMANIAGMDDPAMVSDEKPIDWDALKAINPNVVGWLYLPGTGLNYPIVQGPDNEFYLTHLFDGSSNSAGAIFLDYENTPDLSDPVNFIYGHNMLGNYMFSEITNFVDPSFMAAHPKIIIFTPDRTITLDVIAAMRCKGTDPVRCIGFNTIQDFQTYKESLDAYVVTGDTSVLNGASNIFVFSTCKTFDMNSRIMMIATDNSKNDSTS